MVNQDNRDLVRVATMYYKEDMKQSDIAQQLGFSRQLVSKYLIDARSSGIVDININSSSAYSVQLEIKLQKVFGLKRVAVLDTSYLKRHEVEKLIIQTAISAFKKDVARAKKIGVSWGKMLRRLTDEYPYVNQPDTTIIPLIGGMGSDQVEVHSNQIAHDLSRKMRAKCKYLYVPALVDSKEIKKNLVENITVKDVLEAGKNVDLAFVGIASPFSENNTMTEIGYIDQKDIADLRDSQVIGDVNSRFFDWEGNETSCRINENVIGINLKDIRNIERVCAICFEEEKKDVLYTTVDSGIINCIALTDSLAEYLLIKKEQSTIKR
ncbi:sugar-binding domain-containing protein [Enterococcus dongliensis]|uniref:Sugar-binding domain-containing protein n=1 Tax=Enterococcus dongliensis TaxID=2559925 RepID=A0AAP5NMW9_9ENTE|nr:sugar-binding domain-containing protein [Enterococcus dongliensis]MDT2597539.1 sugar-binding domain-containing protein [Enterococcus dongliensis]MDT2604734.1 sugar-binding domain-containing protein [Enterococcus dongliensis]MDT2635352.1 sugar-binding domain-containing protein [Enterococcus dongliensis]MDT2638262.1 sugar-binding domain-containing protein [Enterococcus dongliensis]MDT2640335.1 sugar-binding domain-containing protein [Enterococcus dongliensis]